MAETQGKSPCLTCGACCAFFRVDFYWRESEASDVPNPVPLNLVQESREHHLCMKGTAAKYHPKCCALEGRIGEAVKCTIYERRPSPCREFEYSYYNGRHNPRCDEARRAHGLQPLRREDVSEAYHLDTN